jgi:DNA polymerase elongation subunit (family B)
MPKLTSRSFKLLDFNIYDKERDQSGDGGDGDSSSSGDEMSAREMKMYIKDNKRFVIQMFAINETGKTCSIIVDDFKPFFYIKVHDGFTNSDRLQFINYIGTKIGVYYKQSICNNQLVNRKKLYGFDGGRDHKFILMQFNNTLCMNKVKNIFYGYVDKRRTLLSDGYIYKNRAMYLYEGNIPRLLRFFHVNEISPSGWIKIPLDKAKQIRGKTTSCDFEFEMSYTDIIPQNDKETIVPYKICSFDIEASSSHGDFPLPVKTYKKLAQNIIDNFIESAMQNDGRPQITKDEFRSMVMSAFGYGYYDKIERIYCKLDLNEEEVGNLIEALLSNPVKNMIQQDCGDAELVEAMYEQSWEAAQNNDGEGGDDGNEGVANSGMEGEAMYSNKTQLPKVKRIEKKARVFDVINMFPATGKVDREGLITILNKCFNAIFPQVEGDKITFIGSTFLKYGDEKPYLNHCIALDTCDQVDGAKIDSYDTEKKVMLAWTELIQKENPDIIIGYNIFGFDYEFMFRRAMENNIVNSFLKLSRNKDELCASRDYKTNVLKIEESSIVIASGQHDLKFIKMNGRLQVDMYNYFRRDYNLTSYKLDYVAGYFIGDSVKRVEYNESTNRTLIYTKNITGLEPGSFINFEESSHSTDYYKDGKKCVVEHIDYANNIIEIAGEETPDMTKHVKWGLAKDDVTPQDIFRMTNEGPKERAVIAKYCIQDCNLVHHLMRKIDVITGYVEMAKICSVPINFVVMRGQGIKLTSYIAKKCREKNTLMPTIEKPEYQEPADGERWSGYDGAIVLPPKCNLYLDNPVACVDYSSLYPSSMISENLSHDSKVWSKEYDLEGNIIQGSEWGARDGDGVYIYNDLPGYEYVDIEHEIYKWQANERGKLEKVVSGMRHCRFAQFPDGKKGIMPSILEELLAARKATRKMIPHQKDDFMKNILDKRQQSYKVTANSLYGGCGAKTSTFFEKDVAASTTATGRKLLTYARRVVEETYGDIEVETRYGRMRSKAEYIYGDTDSVFFTFNLETLDGEKVRGKKALEITIDLAQEAGALATKCLKKPHDLEYEKTFMPFCLLSKKRYVGMLYETDPEKGDRKSMGIVLKRRDNAPIVKDVYGGIIDILMKEQNVERAVEFLRECLRNIVQEKYPLDKLIISKALRSTYKNPLQIAHKVLADRMGKRDPGNKPGSGDRIPFVYIEIENKKALQGEKIEHPDYIIENKLRPNYGHYITNQIMKPVQQVFELVLDDMACFQPVREEFNKMTESAMQLIGNDPDKIEKKLTDLRNRQVKILLFDEFLDEPTKPIRTKSVAKIKDPDAPKKARGRPKKMKVMKEEDDGSITEVIVQGAAVQESTAVQEPAAVQEPTAVQEPAAVAKKPRGRPKKIKVMKEEDDGSITELQEPAVDVQMQEPVVEVPVQEPVPEPEKEPVVPAKKARVRKLKLVIED